MTTSAVEAGAIGRRRVPISSAPPAKTTRSAVCSRVDALGLKDSVPPG